MSMTKKNKLVSALIMLIMLALAIFNVYAGASIPGPKPVQGGDQVGNFMGQILTLVQWVCYGIAVIMLVVLGTKFITSSPEGKAEIKKSAIHYVIGAILVFAAGGILGVIQKVSQGFVAGQ